VALYFSSPLMRIEAKGSGSSLSSLCLNQTQNKYIRTDNFLSGGYLIRAFDFFFLNINFYNLTNNMAISFSNDDSLVVETVEETESLPSDDEDETTTVGSETSMSKYDLVTNALPPFCFFGAEECCALFTQSSDKGKFE
jgi:hypothetical protein